ncbi:MAG: rhodanese-like domain-containing protein [Eubacterium sp.]|jgi:phage shock protein E
MSFLDFFRIPDINAGVQEWKNTKGAVLLDVRTSDEYRRGHIPGSINVPLQHIARVKTRINDLNKPVFVHCLSGSRSRSAVSMMKSMGYTNVKNIGGINSYRGKVVR